MRMIPAELGADSTTTSERRVFEALAASGTKGTALHSLNLPTHEYKLTSELDFVLLLEELVLVVEVKGAQVSCSNGMWTYSDRSGHFRQDREGPFKQVSSGMYALRDRLRRRIGEVANTFAFGFVVVTPDVDLAMSSFEWDPETYWGRSKFNRGLSSSLSQTVTYWRKRQSGKLPIGRELHRELVHELRPSFDRTPLLDMRASTLDDAFVRLTDEQFARLDLISEAPRVICSGGAGTGKTFLATEVARRRALAERSVLFVCRSPILASFVKRQLGGTGVTVASIDDAPTDRTFQVLVADEAQDLMNFNSLDRLECLIEGGLSHGDWVMFMDPNRQAHSYGDFEPEALQFVQSLGPVPATLRTNCRNTREITFQTRALTGADVGVSAAGSGPQVEFVTVTDQASETAALHAHLRRLREQEVLAGAITIISLRGDWGTSAARGLRESRRGTLRRLDEDSAADWPNADLTWASAVDIKGLENQFVCIIDIDSLETETEIDLLYVALSRPRAGLWLAINPTIAARVAELYQTHAATALSALNRAGA